jgi:hypothetical protein
MALLKTRPEASLEERIKSVRTDAAAYIDAAAKEEIKRQGGGIPFSVVRACIAGKRDDLDAYLYLKEQEGAGKDA